MTKSKYALILSVFASVAFSNSMASTSACDDKDFQESLVLAVIMGYSSNPDKNAYSKSEQIAYSKIAYEFAKEVVAECKQRELTEQR